MKTTDTEEKLDLLNRLCRGYWTRDASKAIEYGKLGLALALQLNKTDLACDFQNDIGIAYWYIEDYESALDNCYNALITRQKFGRPDKIASSLNNTGLIYYKLRDYRKAIDMYKEALKHADPEKDFNLVSTLYNNLGLIYIELAGISGGTSEKLDDDDVFEGFHPSWLDNPENLSLFNPNKTDEYLQEAFKYYNKILDHIDEREDMQHMRTHVLGNIGLYYLRIGDTKQALEYHWKALELVGEENESHFLPGFYYNIARIYWGKGDTHLAMEYCDNAITHAKKNDLHRLLCKTFKLKSDIFRKTGDTEKALQMIDQYIAAHQEYSKINRQREITNLRMKYDILEKEQEQEKIRRKNEELEQQVQQRTEQLIEMERFYEVGKFSASIVHNLSGPLTNLMGVVSMIEIKYNMLFRRDATMNRYIKMLNDCADNLKSMIQSITTHVRTSEFMDDQELDLNAILTDEIQFKNIETVSTEKIDIQTWLDDDLPRILGQEVHFRQIFSNLITNACDAMKTTEKKLLHISSRKIDDQNIRLIFEDTGTGISPEHLEKIFKHDFTTKEPGKGTGLGLAITRQMVESYRGTITVSTELGKGTVFQIDIPLGSGLTIE